MEKRAIIAWAFATLSGDASRRVRMAQEYAESSWQTRQNRGNGRPKRAARGPHVKTKAKSNKQVDSAWESGWMSWWDGTVAHKWLWG